MAANTVSCATVLTMRAAYRGLVESVAEPAAQSS